MLLAVTEKTDSSIFIWGMRSNEVNSMILNKIKVSKEFKRAFKRDWQLLLLGAWPTILIILFCYLPMFGVLYAFQDVGIRTSFWENKWVGFKWFKEFFSGHYWLRYVRNTLILSISGLVIGVTSAIIFALITNEVQDGRFKRICQSFSYFPNFISMTVVIGLMKTLLDPFGGILNLAIQRFFGGEALNYFMMKESFLPLYHLSGLWQGLGWSTIIYLGAISGIDPALYEAAAIDGCGRLGKIRYITLPGMKPVIVTMLILNIGNLLSVGYQKVLLMSNPLNSEVSQILSLHVYNRGLLDGEYGYGAAVGLMNSLINLLMLVSANAVSRKLTDSSLF